MVKSVHYVRALRAHAILARNYPSMRRAENFIRITIGTMEEMVAVVQATRDILAHRKGEMADERAVL